MRERFLTHWRGILLSLVGIVATVWLAATGQLGLYIHPRYFVFTAIMAVVAGIFVILAFALLPARQSPEPAEHHDDHEDVAVPSTRRAWWTGASVVLVLITAIALLVLPPATLTTGTVEQRDINGSVAQSEAVDLAGADYSAFTVRDWAVLLRQGAAEDLVAGQEPELLGFVTPDATDPENVFYVARFIITCCAVDAQPVGVPVYLPGWQDEWDTDQWVQVTGSFVTNPSVASEHALVMRPAEITEAEQPAQPYVY